MSDLMSARTILNVVERPTWFGPAESPLFGVAHLPADQKVRGAVLVCGSLGKDHADTLRGLRLLGNELAARGLLVFRFDYLGSGDSSFDQTRAGVVGDWQASVGHAVDYVRESGVSDISAVAVRAGALILDSVLARHPSISRVVYWDPVGSGQRYLREQTAFFKIAVGNDDVPPGVVSTIGARLAPDAAKEFGGLTLGSDAGGVDRLVITRSEGYDKNVRALVESARTTAVLVDGFPQCAQPSRLLVPVSLAAVDAATEWLDQQVGHERTPVTLEFTDSARIPVGDSVVIEQIERISPHDMFAIRTLPDSGATDSVVMFFTNANNPHHGPNREWVELAREVAATGRTALRWDRRGAGESSPPGRDEEVYVYSDRGSQDALAATAHARRGATRVQFAGVCSGSWYAAYGARELGADSVVFVNTLLWSWRIKKVLRARTLPGDDDEIDWEQTSRARMRRKVQNMLPTQCWRVLGHTGVVQAPDVVLSALADRGVAATVILCPHDTKLFVANKGLQALRRLRTSPAPPELVEVPDGDHAAYHQSILAALRRAVLNYS
ncbi:hypothetical protein [Mycobacterium sp. DL592]|uniref:hypothetical protein n=1 Tax=Mycobacterium sp. DL592 TaxID=2675524 RepID=UPI0014227D72|nr:hypothetical protein [Mycobacterium sp. DL592]